MGRGRESEGREGAGRRVGGGEGERDVIRGEGREKRVAIGGEGREGAEGGFFLPPPPLPSEFEKREKGRTRKYRGKKDEREKMFGVPPARMSNTDDLYRLVKLTCPFVRVVRIV